VTTRSLAAIFAPDVAGFNKIIGEDENRGVSAARGAVAKVWEIRAAA
jgi:hypothetical protein